MLRAYKRGANARELEFALTDDEFDRLVAGDCYFCGIPPMERRMEKNIIIANGVDRLDSSKGYVAENCVSCCKECNLAKLDRSPGEFIAHCRAVIHFAAKREKSLTNAAV